MRFVSSERRGQRKQFKEMNGLTPAQHERATAKMDAYLRHLRNQQQDELDRALRPPDDDYDLGCASRRQFR